MSLNKLSGYLTVESGFTGKAFIYDGNNNFYLHENIKDIILEKDDVFGVLVGGGFLYYELPIEVYYENIRNNFIFNVKKSLFMMIVMN